MGSWGPHSLDNDTALDWLSEYRARGLEAAQEVMDSVLDADGGIDAIDGERAVAALEGLATTLGQSRKDAAPIDGLPKVDRVAASELAAEKGAYVIMRLTGEVSEMARLWKDAGPDAFDAWIASLTDLRARITDAASGKTPAMEPPRAEPAGDSVLTLEAIERAIAGLSADLQEMRHDMEEGLKQIRRDILGKTSS